MFDHILRPTFRKALEDSQHANVDMWISVGALVNEHVIDYDFLTYRMAISSRSQEAELVQKILAQIRVHALHYGFLVSDLYTDLQWDDPVARKRILPGVNLRGVTSLGLLAKDVESSELLAVKDI